MAVENYEGGTIITGEHILMYNHMRLTSALGLEITTGLRMSRGSTMLVAAKVCGSTKRTKKGVLADLVKFMEATYPNYRPAPSVIKALGK